MTLLSVSSPILGMLQHLGKRDYPLITNYSFFRYNVDTLVNIAH